MPVTARYGPATRSGAKSHTAPPGKRKTEKIQGWLLQKINSDGKGWARIEAASGINRGRLQMMARGQRPICAELVAYYDACRPRAFRRQLARLVAWLDNRQRVGPDSVYGRG